MSYISGTGGYQGLTDHPHTTTGDKAPQLSVHQEIWPKAGTATNGEFVVSRVYVKNTGRTHLKNISVTVTIQGGNGIWQPHFCTNVGEILADEFQVFEFNDLAPGTTSSVKSYWWKASKPNVEQNGSDFEANFTAIPEFTVSYADNDDYFTDTTHVVIG